MTVEITTGGAGVGKSYQLRELVKSSPAGTLVVAPTGVAALLVGGQTINRAFKLPLTMVGEGDIRVNMRDRITYMGIDRVVLDEGFMTRADMAMAINWTMQLNRGNKFEPFGGADVHIFGDPFQLPPILADKDRPIFEQMGYKSKWIFSLPFMKGAKVNVLTKCYRQEDEEFIAALNEIRIGEPSKEGLDLINSRVNAKLESPFITLSPKNIDVENVNMERYMGIGGEERVYSGVYKTTNDAKFKDGDWLAPIHLFLKVGVQVMMIKNDLGGRWVNGTMAVVSRLGKHSVWVRINGCEYEVEPVQWEKMDSSYDVKSRKTTPTLIASFMQLPMKLAYAVTIHKCQGITLSRGHIELNGTITTEGQAYVMLSRFTSLEAFSLSRPLTISDIRVNMEAKEWYESIAG